MPVGSSPNGDLIEPDSLVLAGAGKMGGALLGGWLDAGLDPRRVTIIDPHAPAEVLDGFADRGVTLNPAAPFTAGTLVLAVKPQVLASSASSLRPWTGADTFLVSVVAGKTVANLGQAFPHVAAIARAMPNTPAAVRRGVTGVFANPDVSDDRRRQLESLLEAVGDVEWVMEETLIDAVTAVSGSGPAYVFYLTECLAKAAERVGLSPSAAARLARATVQGAAALMNSESDVSPELLRRNVTSPGGTTAAALAVLSEGNRLEQTMIEAVAAAHRRAAELSG